MPGQPLRADEREEIRAGIEREESFAEIARVLERPTSTISREVKQNGGRPAYRAIEAERRAHRQRCRRRPTRFEVDPALARRVEARLKAKDSPVTIARQLATEGTTLCAETIYQGVYANGRRGLSAGLHVHLHRRRRRRRPRCRGGGACASRTSPLGTFCLLHQRPPVADERSEVGHFEGDLIIGARNASAVVTLVDRASRFNLLGSLPDGHDATEVLACLVELFDKVPEEHRRSLTWDQGREMARWQDLEQLSGIAVYFCEPRKPWQRPSNEAFNGLVRRWLPKGTDLGIYDQSDLDAISHQINHMPRRSLNWQSSADCYARLALQ
jgi:IS30 family transposase